MRHLSLPVFVSVLILISATLAPAQDVKYEKYALDNGMTIILHEDHSLPVACVNIWYRVGAKDEPPGRSGFAHLFEHLMFMGTQRVPGNDFDRIMESGGGANNAGTGQDQTQYYSSGPASLLPALLWLDADRLEDLGRMMDQTKLDKQRDIVRNEIRQNVENRPYGKAQQMTDQMLFPAGHPYHGAVYGSHEDLKAATVRNVKDFFATYYVPNNAALVVAGDFDPGRIKPLIAELFGTLPRSGEAVRLSAPPVKFDHVLRATTLDKVQLPMLIAAYHSPASFADGDAEMSLVADLLTEGLTSRLYKRLVYDDELASSVSASQQSQQLQSVFQIAVMAQPEADLGRIEQVLDEELARFVKDGPIEQELEQRKAAYELAQLSALQHIQSVADRLNEYEYYFGEPNSFKRDLDRYRCATVAGVRDWAKKVLTPDARVVIRVLPEEPQRTETPRDRQPAALDTEPFSPQAPESFTLSNGIPVLHWQKSEWPIFSMRLMISGSGPLDDRDRAGLAALSAQMLDEGGAGDLDALQFSDALQTLGAEFSADADHEVVTVSLTGLKRNLDKSAALMADAVLRPRFDPKEWERVKRLHLEGLKEEEDQPVVVASRVAARTLFGDAHPYGWPVDGTQETVAKLTVDDIREKHAATFRPDRAMFFVAGDLSAAEAKATLNRLFGAWPAPRTPAAPGDGAFPAVPLQDAPRVVLVHRPEAVQTVIQFIMPGPKFANEQRVSYRLLNTLFGGTFTSRLNQNLREEHGFTYGAHSGFRMEPSAGCFVASSSVKADVTGAALQEFLKEIDRLRGGDISAEESAKARATLRTETIQSFAGLRGVLSEAAERAAAGLPFETIQQDMMALESTSVEQLNTLAGPAMPWEHGVLVLVGDKSTILQQIKDLKLPPPIEVNVRGDPVGSE